MDHVIELVLGPAGALMLALVVIYGSVKKWWVPGWAYKDKEAEALYWREAALRATSTAEHTAEVVKEVPK